MTYKTITKEEMLKFCEFYYKFVTLKTWEPHEYELKYYTPKKIEKTRIKENEKYKLEYEKDQSRYKDFIKKIIDISTIPQEIVNLFYLTIQYSVLDGIEARQKFNDYRYQMEQWYPPLPLQEGQSEWQKDCSIVSYIPEIFRGFKEKYNEEQKKYCHECDPRVIQEYSRKCKTLPTLDMDLLYERASKYMTYKDWSNNSLQPTEALLLTTSKCYDILQTLRKTFNGNPERCVCGVEWGVGGIFNGILEGNGIKVSFKSFIAGGWNIQRRHIRFRITELKK